VPVLRGAHAGAGPHRPAPPLLRRRLPGGAKSRRRAAIGWQALGDELAPLPADPLTRQRETAEAVATLLDGRPAGPPEDRLAQGLVETRQLAFSLRRLAPDLPPALRFRALGLSEAVGSGLSRYFGEVL
jgi:hypothetical protein